MIANPNGELKFIVDYNMFYRKFMELFPNERIKDIHKSMGERLYTFNPTTHTFHQIGSLDMTDSRKIIKKARAEMQGLIPIYLNGKYLRPHLTTLDTNEILQGITFCPEPNFMRELAQTILYKLTDKLEKHGDSSENKGENT